MFLINAMFSLDVLACPMYMLRLHAFSPFKYDIIFAFTLSNTLKSILSNEVKVKTVI